MAKSGKYSDSRHLEKRSIQDKDDDDDDDDDDDNDDVFEEKEKNGHKKDQFG